MGRLTEYFGLLESKNLEEDKMDLEMAKAALKNGNFVSWKEAKKELDL